MSAKSDPSIKFGTTQERCQTGPYHPSVIIPKSSNILAIWWCRHVYKCQLDPSIKFGTTLERCQTCPYHPSVIIPESSNILAIWWCRHVYKCQLFNWGIKVRWGFYWEKNPLYIRTSYFLLHKKGLPANFYLFFDLFMLSERYCRSNLLLLFSFLFHPLSTPFLAQPTTNNTSISRPHVFRICFLCNEGIIHILKWLQNQNSSREN